MQYCKAIIVQLKIILKSYVCFATSNSHDEESFIWASGSFVNEKAQLITWTFSVSRLPPLLPEGVRAAPGRLLSHTFPSQWGKLSHQVYADRSFNFKVFGDSPALDEPRWHRGLGSWLFSKGNCSFQVYIVSIIVRLLSLSLESFITIILLLEHYY